MHTLLLLASFSIIYLALKREYRKIETSPNWNHRSGLTCYILCSAALFLFAVTLNYWVMDITGCIAFHTHNWDTITSLLLGGSLWMLLGISLVRAFWSQRKVHQVMALVKPSQDPILNDLVQRLAGLLGLKTPLIASYHSQTPYAATLFWRTPIILLSSWMLQNLDEEQLEAVIAHELAHIHRRDNLMVTLGGILKDVLFFLPTMRQAWLRFLVDLEMAADDVAVLVTQKPAALASAILQVHQAQPKMAFTYGISYFTPDYQQIEARVERLLASDVHRVAGIASIRFSTLLFGKDILISAAIMMLILSSIFLIPYCHWFSDPQDHHLAAQWVPSLAAFWRQLLP